MTFIPSAYLDMRQRGAVGNGSTDDGPEIQAAIDALGTAGGGTIFFPKGEFRTAQQLVLPRNKPIHLEGVAPGVSSIHCTAGILDAATPVLKWDTTPNVKTNFCRFSNLQISRSDAGPVILHRMETPNLTAERLVNTVFDNCYFRGQSSNGGGSGEIARFEGLLSCSFKNCAVYGGDIGLHLYHCSHVSSLDFRTDIDSSTGTGLKISGGGNHVFTQTRIEAIHLGPGIHLAPGLIPGYTYGPLNVLFLGAFFEGSATKPQFRIEAGRNIQIYDIALATPAQNDTDGLVCEAGASGVVLRGGLARDFTTRTNSVAIRVASGARDIDIQDLNFLGNGLANISIAAGATNVTVRGRQGDSTVTSPTYLTIGAGSATPTLTVNSPTPSIAEGDTFKTANTGATTITNLTGGYEGKTVTILVTDANTTFGDGATLILAGSANFVATADDVLRVMLIGSAWYELSRSVN